MNIFGPRKKHLKDRITNLEKMYGSRVSEIALLEVQLKQVWDSLAIARAAISAQQTEIKRYRDALGQIRNVVGDSKRPSAFITHLVRIARDALEGSNGKP